MDSRSGDRPHWLFSSSLLFSRSALDEGVRAPELVLLSTGASMAGAVGFPLHLRTRAPERVGRGLKRSATVMECGAGVKPEGLCRAPRPLPEAVPLLERRSDWHQTPEGSGRTLSHPFRSGVAT